MTPKVNECHPEVLRPALASSGDSALWQNVTSGCQMLLFFPIYTLGSDSAQNLGICALYKDSSLVMYFFFNTYSFAFLKIVLFL